MSKKDFAIGAAVGTVATGLIATGLRMYENHCDNEDCFKDFVMDSLGEMETAIDDLEDSVDSIGDSIESMDVKKEKKSVKKSQKKKKEIIPDVVAIGLDEDATNIMEEVEREIF